MTDNLNSGTDAFGKLPSPRFSGKANRPNFSKDVAGLRRLAKKTTIDLNALDGNILGRDDSGSDSPGSCGCPLCVGVSGHGASHKSAEFNAVGGNDNFGQNYGKWAQPGGKGTRVDVSFAFAKNWEVPGLSLNRAKTLFSQALQVWSNYAPLNFKEVADPGNGNSVDIRVNDKYIDGNFGTLAYAYFPKGGDITFDSGENWRDNLFLETAVHEIGHALGLGHENGTGAIMNSSIKNRYSGKAFLLQDDINGIKSIYGSGKGSVRRLGSQPKPTPTPTPKPTPTPAPTPNPRKNLVVNGSFENSSVADNRYGVFRQIRGWKTLDGPGIQVDRRNTFGGAAKGDAWVELDSSANSTY